MFLTESELRELWQNGRRPLPAFPPGTRFSPAAQDFLKDHGLTVQIAAQPPSEPAAPDVPASLQARLAALHARATLTAAQARHFRLPALAARLDHLAGEISRLPDGPSPQPTPLPASGLNPLPFNSDHVILHWLRLLHAEAASVAVLAREQGVAGQTLAARLDALGAVLSELEHGFLSGAMAWPIRP